MDITRVNTQISTSQITNKANLDKMGKAEKAAKEFESFFVYTVLEQTQPKIDVDNEFSGGAVEQAFRPILNQYLANEIVDAGGIGLKDNFIKQMNKYQEIDNYGK